MVRRFFDNQSAAAILEIKITISAEEDKFFWVPDKKGSFSVKSTYQERRFRRNRTQVQWDWNKIGKLILQQSVPTNLEDCSGSSSSTGENAPIHQIKSTGAIILPRVKVQYKLQNICFWNADIWKESVWLLNV